METRYALKNPTLCAADPDYAKYSPIEICGYLQDKYGKLFKNGCWPALTDVQQQEGNNITPATPTPSPATSGDQPNLERMDTHVTHAIDIIFVPIALVTGTRQEEEEEEETVLIEMVEEEEKAVPR